MMKKFFTKYLPVEGEIKEGDRAIDFRIAPKDGLTYIKDNTWLNDMGDEVVLPDWKTRFSFKKVKLFLCSRDIQVGDQVLIKTEAVSQQYQSALCGKGVVHQINNEHEIMIYRDAELLPFDITELTKIIGEVSPAAVWIKEGDEFDEGEFKFFWEQNDWDGYSKVEEGTEFYIFYEDLGYNDQKRIDEGWKKTPAHFQCGTCKHWH